MTSSQDLNLFSKLEKVRAAETDSIVQETSHLKIFSLIKWTILSCLPQLLASKMSIQVCLLLSSPICEPKMPIATAPFSTPAYGNGMKSS